MKNRKIVILYLLGVLIGFNSESYATELKIFSNMSILEEYYESKKLLKNNFQYDENKDIKSIKKFSFFGWDKKSVTLGTIVVITTGIDWGQTRYIVKRNKDRCIIYKDGSWWCDYKYYEKTNIYLGKNPSIGEVDTYMPLAIIGTLTIAHLLPEEHWFLDRDKFLYGVSFIEIGTIYNNYKIGLKVDF